MKDKQTQPQYTFEGKRVEELDRATLIRAFHALAKDNFFLRKALENAWIANNFMLAEYQSLLREYNADTSINDK